MTGLARHAGRVRPFTGLAAVLLSATALCAPGRAEDLYVGGQRLVLTHETYDAVYVGIPVENSGVAGYLTIQNNGVLTSTTATFGVPVGLSTVLISQTPGYGVPSWTVSGTAQVPQNAKAQVTLANAGILSLGSVSTPGTLTQASGSTFSLVIGSASGAAVAPGFLQNTAAIQTEGVSTSLVFNHTASGYTFDTDISVAANRSTAVNLTAQAGSTLFTGSVTGASNGTLSVAQGVTLTVSDSAGGGILDGLTGAIGGTLVLNYAGNVTSALALAGSGTVLKTGAGTLTLTKAEQTDITVQSGTLGFLVSGANTSAAYANTLSGAGAFVLSGGGALSLEGILAVTGGATVSAGVLQVGGPNGAGTLSSDVTVNEGATLRFLDMSPGPYSGAISGAGVVGIDTQGVVSLTGTNSYTGGTIVRAGTLEIGTATALPTGRTVNVEAGATLDVSAATLSIGNLTGGGTVTLDGTALTVTASGTSAFTGTMTGGSLTVAGTGTLALTGASSLDAVTVSAGAALELGEGGGLGVGVTNDGTFIFDMSGSTLYSRHITGSGLLSVIGEGTVTLGAANSFGAGVMVSNGTLVAAAAGSLGSGTPVTVAAGATLRLGAAAGIGALSGAGTVDLAGTAFTVGLNNATSSFTGTLSGGGTLAKTGTGTLTFESATLGIDGLSVGAGTLVIEDDTQLASGAGVMVAGGATLALRQSIAIGTLTGAGVVETSGPNVLDLTGPGGVFSGSITGSGSVTFAGSGTTTLSGVNSYVGATTIASGTLLLTGGSALSDASPVSVSSGAVLQLGASETLASLSGSGTVVLGGNVLTVGANGASTVFQGTMSGGSLVKVGGGTLTLAGTTDLTGPGLTISAGTVQIGNGTTPGAFQGAIVNNSALVVVQAGQTVLSGPISGSGSLTVTGGAGTVVLTGTNSYTGGTTISGGILAVGAGGASGWIVGDVAIASGATLAFDTTATNTVGGILSGAGSVLLQAGNLTFSGANTYAGGTVISGGATLHVSQDSNLGAAPGTSPTTGAIGLEGGTLAADASFTSARAVILASQAPNNIAVAGGATLTLSGTISQINPSALLVSGAGTLVLSGANTYSGGTQVTGGTLSVSADANLGATSGGVSLNGATLAATDSFTSARAVSLGTSGGAIAVSGGETLTLSGALSGAGALSLTGPGTLALTGTSAISGTATVANGTLALYGGTLSSAGLTVASGATLTGYGTLSSDVSVLSGGTLRGGVTSTDNPTRAPLTTGDLTLAAGSSSILTLGILANSGVAHVSGDLTAAGTLTVTGDAVHGAGYYRAFTYTGALAETLVLGSVPVGYVGAIDASNGGQVNVLLTDESPFQIWTANGGTSLGGSGLWSHTSVTWNEPAAGITIPWGGEIGIFTGAAGIVTVSGRQTFEKLEFVTSGYVLRADGSNPESGLAFADGGTLWVEGHDVTATIAAPVSGTGGLTKIGAGQLILTGANTYLGGTTVSGGVLAIQADSALGAADGGLTLKSGTLAALSSLSSARSVTLETRGTFDVADGATLTLSGAIAGSGSLRKEGEGRLTLTGTNTYGGATDIVAGILLTQGGSAIPDTSAVSVAAPAVFSLEASETIGSLSGQGRVDLGSNTLTIGGNAATLFAGRISGDGGLALTGGGTLVVTGDNRYTGGTSLTSGTLIMGEGGTSGAIRGDVVDDGRLVFYRSDTVVFDGAISGAGDVAQIGSGTLVLTGRNSYSGTTLVSNGGTLRVSENANLGSDAAELALQGGTLSVTGSFTSGRRIDISGIGTIHVTEGNTLISRGAVEGGALTKSGAGTLVLTGDNLYSGGTVIAAGRLQVGDGGRDGTLRGDVVNHGVLAFDLSSDFLFAGNISGSGTLVQAGSGTLGLTGDTRLTGGARIERGILQVGNYGTQGSLSGPVVNDGILRFARTDDMVFDHVISGSGAVQQVAGVLTLTAANTYAGGTTIGADATVRVSRDDNLGRADGAVRLQGGTLSATASFESARHVALAGGGAVHVTDARTLTLTGPVSGTGGLTKDGGGTLVLAANADYSGGTVIAAGTLQLGTGGTSGSIQGDVANSGTLRVERSDRWTFSGAVSGSGRLVQAGTGTLVLTGTNTYQGGTLISAGTLVVGDGASSGSIVGDVANTGTLVFDRAGSIVFDGTISGSGALVQTGAGILQLTAANSFTGGATVQTGATLSVASDANLGGAASDVFLIGGTLLATSSFSSARDVVTATGTVDVAAGATLTLSGAVTGEGGLTVTGPGTLALSAANAYAGGTRILGSTLSVASDASVGATGGGLSFNSGTLLATQGFTSDRAVTLDAGGGGFNIVTGQTLTLSGAISGSGLLSKGGSGVLVLSGANSYGGGFFIAEGGVVGDSRSLVGDILNNGTLTFNQATAGLYSGTLAGTGSVTKTGAGTLVVTGVLAPEGGTTITEGVLQVGNGGRAGWVSGPIRNAASLVYDLSGTYVFPELLSGSGGVTLTGGGTAVFAGSSYGGTVTLSGANLQLADGASSSASFVVNGASTLSGTGTIGALTIGDGGTVSPGYSPGTLAVAGDGTFQSGSLYRAEVQPGGVHDLIAAGGAVTIADGSAVAIIGSRGTYANSWTFNIITADGGITGAFSSATTNFAFLTPVLTYGATFVDMTLVRNTLAFASEAHTLNERSTAMGTETLVAGNAVYDAVASQLQGEAFAAFDALSGEIYASAGTVMQQQSAYVRDAVGGRLRQSEAAAGTAPLAYGAGGPATATLGAGWTPVLWAQAFGGWGSSFSDGNAATISSSIGGVMGGADVALGDVWRVGAYGGFSQSWFNVSDRLSSGSMDTYDIGLYAGARSGPWSLQLGAGYSWHDVGVSRTVSFPGYLGTNSADYTAGLAQAFGELGYAVAAGSVTVQPFAGLAYVHLDGGSGTEAGSSSALVFSSSAMDTLYTTLGVRAGADIAVAGRTLSPGLTLGWRHAFGDTTPQTVMAYASGSAAFPIWGVPIAADAAVLGANLTYALTSQAFLSLRYDGQIAATASENAVSGALQIRF
ncbi:autotransporter-associated beta strand repeat-containing protein [Aquabacter cavernae]|uniref:autotransporter-associated beta strand repeat-containing protein n=1 Tax=Aquabacter cavernae TaxID=2496029 RepID=UPI000F8F33AC|nr:autotransporter-associated beta strand repeat-containing protein [Aquabacter cavernae]